MMNLRKALTFTTLAAAAFALLAPLATHADTVTVTPTNPAGWSAISQRTATAGFVNGPGTPHCGSGSYHMTTGPGNAGPNTLGDSGSGGKTWLTTQQYDGVKLADITALSYATYVSPSSPTANLTPSIQFQVDLDGNGTRDTAMIFEPVYSVTTQGPVIPGVWQTWDARAGNWWFNHDTVFGASQAVFPSFDAIIAAYPNAQIVTWYDRTDGYGTQIVAGQNSAGAPWANFDGNIDCFTINVSGSETTFDFENVVDVNGSGPGTTGVPNIVVDPATGTTLQDLVNQAAHGAKNHGQYVSTITKLANDLQKSGLITQSQRNELVTGAAQSDIGK